MTISSSLNAGVAGLAANASRLATISDNIANSATNGYKRAVTDFHSMVIGDSKGTYSAGGVRVTTTRQIDQAGALKSTNNATDLAVRGRGFLPVASASDVKANGAEAQMLLTTTGSFRPDADGILTTESGLVLMGWPAENDGSIKPYPRDTPDGLQPVQINANQYAGEPTTKMTLGVNLPATSTEFGVVDALGNPIQEVLSVEYFDNMGRSQSISATFTPTPPAAATDPATNTWTMVLQDSAQADRQIGEYVLVFDASRDFGGTLQSVTAAAGAATDVGTAYDTVVDNGIQVYVGENNTNNPIDISIGELLKGDGFTQLSDSFAPTSILKDGSPVGNMTSVEVDGNGFVHANFDTGITRTIYQIPLVDLPNPNELMVMDNQTYTTSNESGSYFLWDAADGPTGDIVAFALEESAVDVAGELTNLIQTQRAYSSNAKVIQTVDEMLQETTNIKR